jgi:hypothetical protein
MGYQVKTKLELNGVSFKRWDSVSIKQALNTLSSIDIKMPNPAGLNTNIPFEDMPIKFYLGWDTENPPLRFDGSMDDPAFTINKNNAEISMSGRDFGKELFDLLTVDANFNPLGNPLGSGYIISYIRYLNSILTTPLPELFEQNIINDNDSDFSYMFEYEKVIEVLKTLCSYGNYEWKMLLDQNNNRQFSIKAPTELIADNVAHAFIVGAVENYNNIPSGAEIHNVSALSINKNYGYKKNYIKVIGNSPGYGNTGVEAVYPQSPPANPKHLIHSDNGVTNVANALVLAKRLYESKSSPKILVDFSGIGVETLRVGDIVYVNDYRYGMSTLPTNIFKLIEINDTISFGSGWNSSFKVADSHVTMFQIFNDTDGL